MQAPGQLALIVDGSYFDNSTTYEGVPEDAIFVTIGDKDFGKSGCSSAQGAQDETTDNPRS